MNSSVKTLDKPFLACAIAMLVACVLVVPGAFASDQLRSETVKFGDLNVATSSGAEALYARIHAAAKRVCSQPGGQWAQFDELACARESEAKAIGKVNLPMLTAYYESKTGRHIEVLTARR